VKKFVLFFIASAFIFSWSSDGIFFSSKEMTSEALDAIKNSKHSIILLTEVASGAKFIDAIAEKLGDGVEAKIVLSSQSLDKNYSLHRTLLDCGADVFSLKTKVRINSTLLITDGNSLIAGSFPVSDEKYFGYDFCIRTADSSLIDSAKRYVEKLIKKSEKYERITDTLAFEDIASKLKDYAGKEIYLTGRVNEVTKSKKSETYFLKLSSGKNSMTIVFFESFVKELKKLNVNPMYFKNRDVLINGTLIDHEKYGFEIIPSDVSRIKIYTD